MRDPFGEAVLELVTKVGGVEQLASRCVASDAAVLAWIAGQLTPSRDELFLVQLVARRYGLTVPSPPSLGDSAAADVPVRPGSVPDDPADDYREWVKTQV